MSFGKNAGAQSLPRRALYVGAFVVVAAIIGLNVVTLGDMRRSQLQAAETYLSGYRNAVAEQAETTFRAVDAVLSAVANRVASEGVNDSESLIALMANDTTHVFLKDRLAGMPQVVSFVLVNAQGKIAATSYDRDVSSIDIADRDYFRALRDDPTLESFVGAPIKSRLSGIPVMVLARRLTDPNGAFMGVVIGAISLSYLENFYEATALDDAVQVYLLRSDGVELARRSSNGAGFAPKAALDFKTSEMDAVARVPDEKTGETVLFSSRRVANFPIVAAVSENQARILANWTKSAWMMALFSVLNAGLVIFLSVAVERRWRAQSLFLARLEKSEALAREKTQQFETTLAHLPQGLCMFDADKRVVVANAQYAEIYNLPPLDIAPGVSLAEIVEQRVARAGLEGDDPDRALLEQSPPACQVGIQHRMANGRIISVDRYAMDQGGWIAQHTDVTDQQNAMERISFLARHDSLTSLFNRAQLLEEMQNALNRLRRNVGSGFSLLLIDLDMFKAVNDTLGHGVGDALLVEVANRLRGALRDMDVVARLGGDEFAILQLITESSGNVGATTLAERLIARLSEPYSVAGHQVTISASIGLATAPADGLEVDTLMSKADLALYKSKAFGRNTYCFYDEAIEIEARGRRNLQLDLTIALAEGQFELSYQPIISAATLGIICVEALVRWRHPRDGMIAPDLFIPIAEEMGLIVPLGEWILRKACQDALRWPDHLRVAVNISPVQFKNNLVAMISKILKETGLPAARLEMEITEGVFLTDSAENLAILQNVKKLGLSISLDDFGTGYSSFGYIRSFPLDKIKIDRSFVAEALERYDCAAIITAIVDLSRNLNIQTVAEGVETEAQHVFLHAAGSVFLQGYYFGRPMSADEVGKRMALEVRQVIVS